MPRRYAQPKGIRLDIDGLDELVAALKGGEKALPKVYREVLRGPGGRAIMLELRQRTPRKTGKTANSIAIRNLPSRGLFKAGAVEVGVGTGNHPDSKVGYRTIGSILESGAKRHEINPKARSGSDRSKRHGLRMPSGRFVERVEHPGVKPRRVASKSIKASQWEFEAALVDELTRMKWSRNG